MVCRHAEYTLPDHQAGVNTRHFNVDAVVCSVDRGYVSLGNLVGTIGLEALEIHLVKDLAQDIDVSIGPLDWM